LVGVEIIPVILIFGVPFGIKTEFRSRPNYLERLANRSVALVLLAVYSADARSESVLPAVRVPNSRQAASDNRSRSDLFGTAAVRVQLPEREQPAAAPALVIVQRAAVTAHP
jgi:hypothetical protein